MRLQIYQKATNYSKKVLNILYLMDEYSRLLYKTKVHKNNYSISDVTNIRSFRLEASRRVDGKFDRFTIGVWSTQRHSYIRNFGIYTNYYKTNVEYNPEFEMANWTPEFEFQQSLVHDEHDLFKLYVHQYFYENYPDPSNLMLVLQYDIQRLAGMEKAIQDVNNKLRKELPDEN